MQCVLLRLARCWHAWCVARRPGCLTFHWPPSGEDHDTECDDSDDDYYQRGESRGRDCPVLGPGLGGGSGGGGQVPGAAWPVHGAALHRAVQHPDLNLEGPLDDCGQQENKEEHHIKTWLSTDQYGRHVKHGKAWSCFYFPQKKLRLSSRYSSSCSRFLSAKIFLSPAVLEFLSAAFAVNKMRFTKSYTQPNVPTQWLCCLVNKLHTVVIHAVVHWLHRLVLFLLTFFECLNALTLLTC